MKLIRLRPIVPDIAVCSVLVALTFAAYGSAFGHRFLLNWDDLTYVVENESIRGLTWEHVRAAFSHFYFGNYAPLQILSYAVDHALWGLRPGGFIFTNVLLHAVNGVLLYVLVIRARGGRRAACIAAFVFLLHPVQVESVAWISERKNVLSMMFFLVAFLEYVAYRQETTSRRGLRYVLSCTAFAAALLAKAAAVVLPPILLLFDLCFVERSARRRWLADKVPYLVLVAAITAVTLHSQEHMIAEGKAVFEMTPATTVYTMLPVLARYLGLLLWPADLSAIYMPPVREHPDALFAGAALLVSALAAVGVMLFRRHRELFFGYAVFFIGLLPVLHIVPLPTLMNDRYLYFPLVGAATFLGLAADRLLAIGSRAIRWISATAVIAVLAPLPMASRARAEVWRDDIALWTDVTRKAPESTLAWSGLGMALLDEGRRDEALHVFLHALSIDPSYRLALNNVGALYNERGEPEKGRAYLLRVVELYPDYFDAFMNLGIGYRMTGNLASAANAFRAALAVEPGSPAALAALDALRRALQADAPDAPTSR